MSTLAPYWTSPDGRIVVYHSRWEDVHAAGLLPVREVALVHADPPYGNGDDAHRPGREEGARVPTKTGVKVAKGRAWKSLAGNAGPFDPSTLLGLSLPTVAWGGNHYASRLPDSTAWLFWDKRVDSTPDSMSDGELAWTNLGGALRVFRHVWRGLARSSETCVPHLHPTQKPIALSSYVFQRAKLKPGDLVFVPYLGSGPDLPAAVAMGLKIIACDVESWCCDTAISRLRAITPAKAAEPVGPLFGGAL